MNKLTIKEQNPPFGRILLTGVEEDFRELKSFLKFKPSFIYTDKHVRAHYTICILGYLLDVTITNKLRKNPGEKVSSVRKVDT